jgi:crotonobetainyl-CoA:carnitine CoA-transferase CaiB-like acyl-CoA transferase
VPPAIAIAAKQVMVDGVKNRDGNPVLIRVAAGGAFGKLAMLDVMVTYLWPEAISSLTFVGNESDPAKGQMGLGMVFKTRDRYITAGAISDAEWGGMCRALQREDLIDDPRFVDVAGRTRNIAERRAIAGQELAKWNMAENLTRLDRENVPAAPILSRTELLDDPQIALNGVLEIIRHKTLGEARQPRPAARFDMTSATARRMAHFLGEHNTVILEELGYPKSEAGKLACGGVLAAQNAA